MATQKWLTRWILFLMDSNHVKKINSFLCYRYTKEQNKMEPEVGFEPTTDGLSELSGRRLTTRKTVALPLSYSGKCGSGCGNRTHLKVLSKLPQQGNLMRHLSSQNSNPHYKFI